MTEEHDNALAIAKLEGELRGELKAIRSENDAMESRIDASLARLHEEMAKRETRLLLAIAGMIGLAVAILGLWLG